MDWFYAYVGMRRSSRLILETPEAYREQIRAEGRLKALEGDEGKILTYDDSAGGERRQESVPAEQRPEGE